MPGLVLAAAGMAAMAVTGTPSAVIGGALVFGAGFGVLQNATLALMYARVPAGGESAVSAIWNAAYDLGMAAGALGAGLVDHLGRLPRDLRPHRRGDPPGAGPGPPRPPPVTEVGRAR